MTSSSKRMLSHYTSRAGLEGIARSGALWATNFLTMNDSSEYLYAWEQIQAEAFRYVASKIPADLLKEGADPDIAMAGMIDRMREVLTAGDGYGQLFITSFAIARDDEEARRGSLTLWDRYTGLKGYCLQFKAAHLRHRLELDAMKAAYGLAVLADVTYGVDTTTRTFRELVFQFGEQLLLNLAQQTGDRRIQPKHEAHWAPSVLATRLLRYCGAHKDGAFHEEHEARILVYPVAQNEPRILTGIAQAKTIHAGPGGRKHVVIGDLWHPGLSPSRIIIGPHADPDIEDVVQLFHTRPEVARCDIPIRPLPG